MIVNLRVRRPRGHPSLEYQGRVEEPQGRYFYETTMHVMDSKGGPIWSGKIYTEWYTFAEFGKVYYERPAIFDRPEQAKLERVP